MFPKQPHRAFQCTHIPKSGINLNHTEFFPEPGGATEFSDSHSKKGISRARWGATVISENESVAEIDELGHGTHVAGTTFSNSYELTRILCANSAISQMLVLGTVGGNTFGIAKEVSLVAVKLLDKCKRGKWTSVLRGLAWVAQDVKRNQEEGRAPRGVVVK